MLRWPIANLITFFNVKRCKISSGLSPKFWFSKFWFSDCSVNFAFWGTGLSVFGLTMELHGLTVTNEITSVVWKLSFNRHKPVILWTTFMVSLPEPLSARCRPFLPKHFLSILLLTTIEFNGIQIIIYVFHCKTRFSIIVLPITVKIINLHCGREFCMKILRLRILCSTTRQDWFTQLFVPTCM